MAVVFGTLMFTAILITSVITKLSQDSFKAGLLLADDEHDTCLSVM